MEKTLEELKKENEQLTKDKEAQAQTIKDISDRYEQLLALANKIIKSAKNVYLSISGTVENAEEILDNELNKFNQTNK